MKKGKNHTHCIMLGKGKQSNIKKEEKIKRQKDKKKRKENIKKERFSKRYQSDENDENFEPVTQPEKCNTDHQKSEYTSGISRAAWINLGQLMWKRCKVVNVHQMN